MQDGLTLPVPEATTVDRIRYLIKFMRKTQAQFGEMINVDASNMSKFLSGRIPITDGFINRIVVNMGVSKQWLTTGEGVPFPKEAEPEVVTHGGRLSRIPKGAPVYDIDATAGFGEISRQFTEDKIMGYLSIPQLNPNFPVIRVFGDSMEPRICHGGFISVRPISNDSPIYWGKIYVVVLEDYRMVKILRRHPDNSKVILHSVNPDYDDMEIPRSSITQMFIVETIMNYDICG